MSVSMSNCRANNKTNGNKTELWKTQQWFYSKTLRRSKSKVHKKMYATEIYFVLRVHFECRFVFCQHIAKFRQSRMWDVKLCVVFLFHFFRGLSLQINNYHTRYTFTSAQRAREVIVHWILITFYSLMLSTIFVSV